MGYRYTSMRAQWSSAGSHGHRGRAACPSVLLDTLRSCRNNQDEPLVWPNGDSSSPVNCTGEPGYCTVVYVHDHRSDRLWSFYDCDQLQKEAAPKLSLTGCRGFMQASSLTSSVAG